MRMYQRKYHVSSGLLISVIFLLIFSLSIVGAQTETFIEGYVFHDMNANAMWDAGEEALSDWGIELYDNNGVIIASTYTLSNGYYGFYNLASGTYVVREVCVTGWWQSLPAQSAYDCGAATYTISLPEALADNPFNFGNFQNEFTIEGHVFHDRNDNGSWDTGEEALSGWVIELLDSSYSVIAQASSSVNGYYAFSNLGPGNYLVQELCPAGWRQSVPGETDVCGGVIYQVILPYDIGFGPYDFGNFHSVTIHACKLNDLDGDPLTEDRLGISAWPIDLFRNGVHIDSQLTGADACYTWSELNPGVNYSLAEASANGWIGLTPTEFAFPTSFSGDIFEYTFINSYYGEGCSLGFWKNPKHQDNWLATGYMPQDAYQVVFGVGSDISLMDALKLGGGHEKALMRQSVAALLNAAHPDVDYVFSVTQVLQIVQDAYNGIRDIEEAKDILETANTMLCPID